VTRYAVNSWGMFFLEAGEGVLATLEGQAQIISLECHAGILGTFFSGILSDKFFKGRAQLFPHLNFWDLSISLSISSFCIGPANSVYRYFSMVMFGTIHLVCFIIYLGGINGVDIASKEHRGTALGIVGVASYHRGGFQDICQRNSSLKQHDRFTMAKTIYNFRAAGFSGLGIA